MALLMKRHQVLQVVVVTISVNVVNLDICRTIDRSLGGAKKLYLLFRIALLAEEAFYYTSLIGSEL